MKLRPRLLSGIVTAASALALALVSCAKDLPTATNKGAAKLLITVQPVSPVAAGSPIRILVLVADASGNPVVEATPAITISQATGGTAGAVLGGTLTRAADNGVALFNDLTVDKAGVGYALTASASGGSLAAATSNPFTVTSVTVPVAGSGAGVAA